VAAADTAKLAMRGYDPVNYFTEGRPAKGAPEFSHVWDGERYLFASARHRDMFASDPARYAPQFPGHCAAALAAGQIVSPNPEYWIIVEGRLYLFGGEAGPEKVRANPTLIQKAEENWPRKPKAD
jgi:YHS domain-containing protein